MTLAETGPSLPRPEDEGLIDGLFRSASVGLAVSSADGVILRANPAFAALLGMTPAEVEGRTAVELTHPDDREVTGRLFGETATWRPHLELDKRYLRKDGTGVWAHVSADAICAPDGSVSHHLITVRDLTATRALAERLREASIRYGRLFEANVLGIAIAGETRVVEANDEFLRVAGTTRAAFEALGVDWRAITPAEHLPKDLHALQELKERGACAPFEKEYEWPDGTRVPILVGAAQLEARPLRWIAFTLDLTERRRAEAERDHRLEEARLARAVAEAALHGRDQLLAKVTHDLRTPIAANVGYLSMIRDGIPEPLPPAHQRYVERMLANQHHMLGLLDQLLEFARGAYGDRVFEAELVEVGALFADLEPLVGSQARAAGVNCVCEEPDAPLSLRADRVKTLQVLANVVGNGVKFTPAGGTVRVTALAADNVVRIAVTDTGPGIPETDLERIFEPFVRGRPSVEAPPAPGRPLGFGLGLAISRELARGMGGDLTVESTFGAGSTFTLTLPLA